MQSDKCRRASRTRRLFSMPECLPDVGMASRMALTGAREHCRSPGLPHCLAQPFIPPPHHPCHARPQPACVALSFRHATEPPPASPKRLRLATARLKAVPSAARLPPLSSSGRSTRPEKETTARLLPFRAALMSRPALSLSAWTDPRLHLHPTHRRTLSREQLDLSMRANCAPYETALQLPVCQLLPVSATYSLVFGRTSLALPYGNSSWNYVIIYTTSTVPDESCLAARSC
ncbi:hypothetical protein EJ04DRAFT_128721 [Polyplosphaeria fusca]|uniref:Uncharacterized protein n=1 Tax=Polyplosphaeria fusca TaxID=682080 RepID=A0A9P4QI78_9PLEO|nr:hypothetical protein EJ04DRAFT_128721 [Polyplosphaeria fusca]